MTRRLTDHELQLWAKVARSTRPLRGRRPIAELPAQTPGKAEEAKPAPKTASPKPASNRPPERVEGQGRRAPPQDASGHRNIRRGAVGVEARIDLHGHTQDTAREVLIDFILEARRDGARRLLVITGKGRNGQGVLRARFLDWIADPEVRPFIAGYAPAHVRHGGEGAFYLLLKAR